MTSSLSVPYASLRGDQQPRISSFPSYTTSAGPEAIKLARLAGIELDPWQQTELVHGLGESADWKCPRCTHRAADPIPCPEHSGAHLIHPWAAFEVASVVPRQNGKSELLIVRQLAGLFILEEPLQIYSAHLFDTAMEVFRRLAFVVENCDDLRREVKHRGSKMVGIKYSHGDEGIELQSGLRVRFKARTGGGGRGFSCDTLYLDEAMILKEAFLGATVPTLSARSNPQIYLAGSPPDEEDPAHDGVVLAKRRARAVAGDDPSLAYFEHSADGDHPDTVGPEVLDDPEQWAKANPGLGIRITADYIENERRAMGARQFAVERLGIGAWPSIDDEASRVITAGEWAACADSDSRIASAPTFAIDVDPEQAWATIAAAGMRDDGLCHVGIVDHRRGATWVGSRISELLKEHDGAQLVVDPHAQAKALIIDLENAGIYPVRVSAADYAEACSGFQLLVHEGRLRYMPPQPELDAAVAGARTTGLLDAWKWARQSGVITPLVASTLAVWCARTQGPPEIYSLSEEVAKLQGASELEAQASATPAGFVALADMPTYRGAFRP